MQAGVERVPVRNVHTGDEGTWKQPCKQPCCTPRPAPPHPALPRPAPPRPALPSPHRAKARYVFSL